MWTFILYELNINIKFILIKICFIVCIYISYCYVSVGMSFEKSLLRFLALKVNNTGTIH